MMHDWIVGSHKSVLCMDSSAVLRAPSGGALQLAWRPGCDEASPPQCLVVTASRQLLLGAAGGPLKVCCRKPYHH